MLHDDDCVVARWLFAVHLGTRGDGDSETSVQRLRISSGEQDWGSTLPEVQNA